VKSYLSTTPEGQTLLVLIMRLLLKRIPQLLVPILHILLVIHEAIYNGTSNTSLLSEFQLREHGILIDSICNRHEGTQKLTITDSNYHDDITIPLELAGCMVHFIHRFPTKGEIMPLQQYCLTQGDTPWNPSSFSDQVADVYYKQVIDTESYNANSMKLCPYDPSDI
jgi:hypothetical protein